MRCQHLGILLLKTSNMMQHVSFGISDVLAFPPPGTHHVTLGSHLFQAASTVQQNAPEFLTLAVRKGFDSV